MLSHLLFLKAEMQIIMSRQDLQWLLAFAKSHSLMKEPITIVLPLWIKDLEDYYEDMIADYWIDIDKERY